MEEAVWEGWKVLGREAVWEGWKVLGREALDDWGVPTLVQEV